MSIFSFGPDVSIKIWTAIFSLVSPGFILGFYLAFLFCKKKKYSIQTTLLSSFIFGIVLSFVGVIIFAGIDGNLQRNNQIWNLIKDNLVYFVLGELLLAISHYMLFFKKR